MSQPIPGKPGNPKNPIGPKKPLIPTAPHGDPRPGMPKLRKKSGVPNGPTVGIVYKTY